MKVALVVLIGYLAVTVTADYLNEEHLIKINDENVFEKLEHQAFGEPAPNPLFLFFMNRDCDACWAHLKDWDKLSTIAYRNFQIARTDW